MTSVSKNVFIDELDDIVNKFDNRYDSAIKREPVDITSSTYIDFDKKNNKEDPKFKFGDQCKNIKI